MPRLSARSELFKIASVVATIPACFLIFFGGFVLMRYGLGYPAHDLVRFAVFPLIGGVCWLFLAAWFWRRAVGSNNVWDSLRIVSLRAFGAIALGCLAVLITRKLHGR